VSRLSNPGGDEAPRETVWTRDTIISIVFWVLAGAMTALLAALIIVMKPALPFMPASTATMEQPTMTVEPTQPVDPKALAAAVQPDKALIRAFLPHTDMVDIGRTEAIKHEVEEGDSLFALSKEYELKPETIFWANFDKLEGSPDSIAPGIEIIIPPVDGVYYKWREGDTLQSVSDQFGVKPDIILESVWNKVDLTNPVFEKDSYVMIQGGESEAVQWFQGQLTGGNTGTTSYLSGGGGCGAVSGGAGDGSFGWPIASPIMTGNDYIPGVHQGIDLGSSSSVTIVAADSGVVAYSGWANGGYGITVLIDHGNGFQSLYAHMSTTLVSCGQPVGQGQQVGILGSTGNSTGPHLHFEIRYSGLSDSPYNYLP